MEEYPRGVLSHMADEPHTVLDELLVSRDGDGSYTLTALNCALHCRFWPESERLVFYDGMNELASPSLREELADCDWADLEDVKAYAAAWLHFYGLLSSTAVSPRGGLTVRVELAGFGSDPLVKFYETNSLGGKGRKRRGRKLGESRYVELLGTPELSLRYGWRLRHDDLDALRRRLSWAVTIRGDGQIPRIEATRHPLRVSAGRTRPSAISG